MKTTLLKKALLTFLAAPALCLAQDLTPGMNVSYTPPSSCSNQVNSISVDICNNDQVNDANGPFMVAMYLYDSGSSQYWIIGSLSINKVSAAACLPITNWNVDMNQAASLPNPGYYKLGVWVDTANNVTETDENNNAGLLSSSADIQVCSTNAIKTNNAVQNLSLFPIPAKNDLFVTFSTQREENLVMEICDVTGKSVRIETRNNLAAGNHLIRNAINDLPDGVYLMNLKASDGNVLRKKFVISH